MTTSADSSQHFWNKFRYSTKSLQTSFAGLSIKSESDGDSPNSTVVHKALVKFYKNQEPFTGFPGWLGEKEDLPDEQKILKRQAESKISSSTPSSNTFGASISNGWNSFNKASVSRESNGKSPIPTESSGRHYHTSAGMSFQKIYNKEPSGSMPSGSIPSSELRSHHSAKLPGHSQSTNIGSDTGSERRFVAPTRSNTASSSSSMMRDRLKRNNTKNSFNF